MRFIKKYNKPLMGFTLAEVLITLTIIGVIASITVPNLINNFQHQANYVNLKKYYSVLSNAYKLIEREEGDYDTWGVNNSNDITEMKKVSDKFLPYLKTEKVCTDTAGCWNNAPTKTLNKKNTAYFSSSIGCGRNMVAMKMQDGINICFDVWGNSDTKLRFGVNTSTSYPTSIWVDTNGIKGPNVVGRDVFAFILSGNGLLPAGTNNQANCKLSHNDVEGGFQCTARVFNEGGIKY